MAKYDTSGGFITAFNLGGSSDDFNGSLATDAAGNLYVAGSFQTSNVDFDPSSATSLLSSNGGTDIFLAKYNSSGLLQWVFQIGKQYFWVAQQIEGCISDAIRVCARVKKILAPDFRQYLIVPISNGSQTYWVQSTVPNGNFLISRANLFPPVKYFLTIISSNGKRYLKKLVKQ